jgi:hypothetical protein
MKLGELQDVCQEAELMIDMCSIQIRRRRCEIEEEQLRLYWLIGHYTLRRDELNEHIHTLERILQMCEAVKQRRYPEDWQRCTRLSSKYSCEHACMSSERCDGFDERDAHTVIAEALSELEPFSNPLRGWILYQFQMQRRRRELICGPDGLLGDAKIVIYGDDGSGVLKPMSDEEASAAMAQQDAKEDAENEAMALRIDQYELNRQRIVHLCEVKGDLQEVAAIIEGGMPPQVRRGIATS